MTSRTVVSVTGTAGYDVVIGHDLFAEVAGVLSGATQVALVHPPTLARRASELAAVLERAELRVRLIEIPDAEQGKTVEVAAQCWDTLAEHGFTRSDAVVGFGGGATTDLAGWVAAAWLRGVRVVQVPTTLVGMVDAAIGGKTGVNIAAGKNLVGAFHPPAGVFCDLQMLSTVPADDYRAGLAEVVKCGFIADPVILDLIEGDPVAVVQAGNPVEAELIRRSVQIKADVVGQDLTEQGLREILNYGHTLGHAIERAEGYRWRHGDAVSVGIVFAAGLARALGRLDDATADRHRRLLHTLGLPTSYHSQALPQLLETMRIDKKSRGNRLRFVVLDALAQPGRAENPELSLLEAAYREVAAKETV